MTPLTWIEVLAVGGAGAVLRFTVDSVVSARFGRGFPLGTLLINLTGACVLGFLTGLAVTGNALVVLGTAAVGSYTTFSTWMLETHRLREEGDFLLAFGNAAVSLLVGLGAVALGRTIGGQL